MCAVIWWCVQIIRSYQMAPKRTKSAVKKPESPRAVEPEPTPEPAAEATPTRAEPAPAVETPQTTNKLETPSAPASPRAAEPESVPAPSSEHLTGSEKPWKGTLHPTDLGVGNIFSGLFMSTCISALPAGHTYTYRESSRWCCVPTFPCVMIECIYRSPLALSSCACDDIWIQHFLFWICRLTVIIWVPVNSV